ncbi:MAG: M4 family metallopeptidase [Ignavibacteria bacterium]|nr:M4 family metallopeptidase [Ignavibacteria bacterium]MBT8383344.1 M4 family metallopeptidase [Ignavibacteria bacterium]MBT8391416.1 M4 family metallopeptidase [Ignavibacteria bacterium]NNJ52406.1 T9SS type A sorting domain-containing protein [Ignavibacteriaceae bacterium]NNL19854.1 T9SS type A sorting domain-containing protein [Ignavibacteriaceae bacterium]
MKLFKDICIFLFLNLALTSQIAFAQQAYNFFSSAQIGWDVNTSSPYEVRFAEDSDVSVGDFFNGFKTHFGLSDYYSFEIKSQITDQIEQTHYRFNQFYKGIKITGAQFILHEKNGNIHYANGHLLHNINIDVNPAITEQTALSYALSEINAQKYMWEDQYNEQFLKSEQNNPNATFYPSGNLILTTGRDFLKGENIKLAYRFDVYAEIPLGRYYIDVDAETGKTVNVISRLHDADVPGTGTTHYNGNVEIMIDSFSGGYRLREYSRGNGIETYNMNNTTNYSLAVDFVDSDTSFSETDAITGVSAHWAIEGAYDYYWIEHALNSVNGNGFRLRSYVHYSSNYFNAFWDGQRMTFGDGSGNPLVTIDIAAHEMTHGVTQFSAGLIYQDESGALNESFSDIFGAAVEFYLEGPTGDWFIAEDLGGAFRSMENPKVYNDPNTYKGQYWVPAGGPDNGGVHSNSGVQNYWFYLLTEGGSGVNDNGDNYSVTGIGLEDAAKIAYRNLSVYLTPPSPFFDARLATINSAADLFGVGSQQYLSALDAWNAVGVYQPYLENRIGVSADSLNFLAEVSFNTDSSQLVISNIGLQPLAITDIQLSGENFIISSMPSFPVVLNNYEDNFPITIVFNPTEAGVKSGTITISSDDAVNPVKTVSLRGKGFTIEPATEKILYASSGLDSDGMILTIDLVSGQGSLLGPSQFEEVKDIAIHPSTKIMYGLIPGNTSAKILRVNSAGGDAYLLYEMDVSSLAAIAFDKNETLYGISQFGEVYTIDLSNGSYNFVVNANTSVSGISFHPVTNELWASSRGFIGPNKDKIFKVDLTTGDITLIGNTGLPFMTNDIAFDEKLNLYGLIGGSGQVSDLVEINTTTGEGTIIGSAGFENILGLAYLTGSLSSASNEEQLPTEFVLEQNYPNPFNPSTTIKFHLPEKSFVNLNVFNLIGEEVGLLINAEMPAGIHKKVFDAESLPSGIYFYTIRINDGGEFIQTNKMLLLK